MRELEKSQRFGMWDGRWGGGGRAASWQRWGWGSDPTSLPGPPYTKSILRKGQEDFFNYYYYSKIPDFFPRKATKIWFPASRQKKEENSRDVTGRGIWASPFLQQLSSPFRGSSPLPKSPPPRYQKEPESKTPPELKSQSLQIRST